MASAPDPSTLPTDQVWYTQEFRNVLEDHITFIRNNKPTAQALDANQVIKYRFDFFSLLSEYNIPSYMHWITMRVNGLKSSIDDFSMLENILCPDPTILNQILQHYHSRNRARGA